MKLNNTTTKEDKILSHFWENASELESSEVINIAFDLVEMIKRLDQEIDEGIKDLVELEKKYNELLKE